MIPVTKTYIPDIQEYHAIVQRAFDKGWVSNRGELVLELEDKITKTLSLDQAKILCLNNGTSPLQIALKALAQNGEVITTPFSYVATTAAIIWENCTPVFVDIHPEYLTIDETKIEAAITNKTTCILATHVYGNPCNVDAIEKIAKKHSLKVIYDAAHCFGVTYNGKSIFEYGDISTCSFHATKIFHTGEGGALFCKDEQLFFKLFNSHNFGHNGPEDFHGLGINAKMSELNAAMGLAVLPHFGRISKQRGNVVKLYNKHITTQKVTKIVLRNNTIWNNSYYPIIFKNEDTLLKAVAALNENNIFPRRYFYPSLNKLPYLTEKSTQKVSEEISSRILCLPIYHNLEENTVLEISQTINKIAN